MRTFRIYRHETKGFEAVKVGFSWPCLFFGIIWALVKRLWMLAVILAVVTVVATLLDVAVDSLVFSMVLNLGFVVGWIVLSFHGNDIRESVLQSRGYRLVTELQADSPADAITLSIRPRHKQEADPASVEVAYAESGGVSR